ncbi:MAG: hypothetical protein RQ731_04380 [Anaerosomatales bacterium]|nr:hypothetical protein [Anaerosomatales bacterium]MDT8433978.1 hypothetical protein [Anaerosomatales bacterium]
MTTVMWIAVGALLLALIALQLVGARALSGMGVQPSRAVVALRAVNVAAVIAVVAFAFWKWVS